MLTQVGLLATEMCTQGGVQSFMWRLAEVLDEAVREGEAASGRFLSLNDPTQELQNHPARRPSRLALWGAERSKPRFIAHSLRDLRGMDVLLVGHVGISPVAYALHRLGWVKRYYVILHGIEAWQRQGFLERQALRAAAGAIATTRYTAELCARENDLPTKLFRVIPLCADEREVAPTPGFFLKGDFKLLCVARQDVSERYKGFTQVFTALAHLRGEQAGVHLNLVGDGNDQPQLRRQAQELGVADRVTFWGRLPDGDLAAAYEDCDLFVMPSRKEGFGIVFLEAMRRGKPCIGGRHGGTPEVIDDGRSGFLIDYGDAVGLADQIRTLHADPNLRRTLGVRGRELVKSKFSAAAFASAYRSLLFQPAR